MADGKYVLDLLADTRKFGTKLCNTPIDPNLQLTIHVEQFEHPK